MRAAIRPPLGAWRSLVAHLTGGQGVAGSNPVAPTIFLKESGWLEGSPSGGPFAIPGRCHTRCHRPTSWSIPFTKPGTSDDWDVMAETAIRVALTDAGVGYEQIQQAYAGYVYADSTAGQSALYRVGCTGIPIVNVNNNCSTGATALYLARQLIASGGADCVLAVGFEQMPRGAMGPVFTDRKRTPFSCEGRRAGGRSMEPASPCSITSAWAAPVSSVSTADSPAAIPRPPGGRPGCAEPVGFRRRGPSPGQGGPIQNHSPLWARNSSDQGSLNRRHRPFSAIPRRRGAAPF